MEDAELAERLYATAGRLLDASTLSGDPDALKVARTTAELARRALMSELSAVERSMAELVLSVEGAAFNRADELSKGQSH